MLAVVAVLVMRFEEGFDTGTVVGHTSGDAEFYLTFQNPVVARESVIKNISVIDEAGIEYTVEKFYSPPQERTVVNFLVHQHFLNPGLYTVRYNGEGGLEWSNGEAIASFQTIFINIPSSPHEIFARSASNNEFYLTFQNPVVVKESVLKNINVVDKHGTRYMVEQFSSPPQEGGVVNFLVHQRFLNPGWYYVWYNGKGGLEWSNGNEIIPFQRSFFHR